MPYYVMMSEGKPPNHAEKEMQVKVHKHTFQDWEQKKKKKEDTPGKQLFD
jgi:mevalonate pyrophosphate decarboxylase